MANARPTPVPEHLSTITPRLLVPDGPAAITFYLQAFGGREIGERFLGPRGELIHAEVQIGDSVVMISEDAEPDAPAVSPGLVGGKVTTLLATYWPDVDAVWASAIAAGAEVVYPLGDQFYGDRGGRIRDPFGHQWMLAQRIEILSAAEMDARAAAFFANEPS